ncbi:MAG: polyphenol oxidase family protein [Actinomycetota bacterium]|nr:polyphenol oxidase family protein [Actinomycetota bacterium]
MIEVELPGARAFFSTRQGGVSEGPYESLNLGILTDDDQDRVAENRRRVLERAGIERFAMGHQVHGAELLEWDVPPAADGFANLAGSGAIPGPPLRQVDGHATGLEGLGLLVLVADCLPLALAAPGRVAMLHCGWRGLAAGIVERALATFEGEPPAAALGPCIGRCCYEVGPEVLEAFADLGGVAEPVAEGRMLSLRAVAEAKLRAAGVGSVEHVDLCTSCRPDLFFSHRRDDGLTGRQCGIVVRA